MRTLLALLFASLALSACRQSPVDPGRFTLTGTWDGTRYPWSLRMELNQTEHVVVRGTGTLRALREVLETDTLQLDPLVVDTLHVDTIVAATLPVAVDGLWDHPGFTLTLTAEGYADAAYAANFVTADSVSGTLSGSGFASAPLSLRRVRATD